jgi:hypothetical protein
MNLDKDLLDNPVPGAHLTGWVPKTIPLQLRAVMALSACSGKQKNVTALSKSPFLQAKVRRKLGAIWYKYLDDSLLIMQKPWAQIQVCACVQCNVEMMVQCDGKLKR